MFLIVDKPIRLGGLFDIDGKKRQARAVWEKHALSPTLDTMQGGYRQPLIIENNIFKIRKLTPLECWRLQGLSDEQFKCAKDIAKLSNTKLYERAGRAIVVHMLVEISRNLLLK